jgi:hypothetical protein
LIVLLSGLLAATPAAAAENTLATDFQPDPASVQHYNAAYRYPQAGWIVLHIEGEPYERGYQHGKLMAPEIAAHLRCFAAVASSKAPNDGWRHVRTITNALFVRRYDEEYLEEMKGIAEGATAGGARFNGRPVDLVDIVALNCWPEIDTLESALEATPTGLEGKRFPKPAPRAMPAAKPAHCSAFAATGPATADGKIVFGHITMFSLYPSNFYNVWLDVKPSKGNRVLMQTYPGGIQSGLDYYMNDAGLLVCETTLAQTHFDITGLSVASRIRQALQYADNIDKAVEILGKENNGLYTNEWLLGDIKTNEIAMYELGTHKSKLYRSSKNEWFGGTDGFYWGCNNTKDLEVRLETIPSVEGDPGNMVFRPADRDKMWLQLYEKYRGKIDADFGRIAFTTPPLAAYHSLDAKYTTSAMAKDLKTFALFGPPLGNTWQPTNDERQKYPEIQPLVSNPWTVLHTQPPAADKTTHAAVDLKQKADATETKSKDEDESDDEEDESALAAVWHGTLLPQTDADVWLATAFADYHHIVALEKSLRHAGEGKLSADDRDRLAVERYAFRSDFLAGSRAGEDIALEKTKAALARDDWYRVAAGKGVWLLHELRQILGDKPFEDLMESFGKENAGKPVTTAQFRAAAEKAAGKKLDFFDYWLKERGLPDLKLIKVTAEEQPSGKGYHVVADVSLISGPARTIPLTVETTDGEETHDLHLEPGKIGETFTVKNKPRRFILDKYGQSAKVPGGVFALNTFSAELEQSLIVYGTSDEVCTNREAAQALQKSLIQRWSNITVPVKADKDVTEDDCRTHHLLLIGRPDSNLLVERFKAALPVQFGWRSFTVREETYAHPGSAVMAVGENPINPRYSVVVVAGLGGAATLKTAPTLGQGRSGQVLIVPQGGKRRDLVLPPKEFVVEWKEGDA